MTLGATTVDFQVVFLSSRGRKQQLFPLRKLGGHGSWIGGARKTTIDAPFVTTYWREYWASRDGRDGFIFRSARAKVNCCRRSCRLVTPRLKRFEHLVYDFVFKHKYFVFNSRSIW
jgi:hypothetical protein